jgi:hypothetical protein
MTNAWLVAIVFFAALLQTTSGFGFALMAMPLISLVVGVKTAAPLVAMLGFTLYAVNLVRYRHGLVLREVARLAVAAAVGVPVGVWLLSALDERVVEAALGVVLIGYAAYMLLKPQATPSLQSNLWAYPVGFISGCLGGAFNTPGPPVIIYGDLKQWPRNQFRSTLQALFLFTSGLVILSHAFAGHVTRPILVSYALSIPFLLLGVLAGSHIDRRLDNERFRMLVIVMILATGVLLLV